MKNIKHFEISKTILDIIYFETEEIYIFVT